MDVFVRHIMETLGPAGIALLMFLENIFPPIPSELIMPLAGYQAALGEMSIGVVIFAGLVGSVLGIIPWYWLGLAIGERRIVALAARYGRWLTMTPEDVEAADRWFLRKGWWAVFLGRLVPTVRTLISVPAGLARMPFGLFLLLSALGSLIWTAGLALAGYLLGQQYEAIEGYIGPVSNAVVVAAIGIYLWRVVTFKPGPRAEAVDLKSNEAPHRYEGPDA